MKKTLISSIVLTTFALSIVLFQISCKKEATAPTSTTTSATLTKEQILVQKKWKLDQLHRVINGSYASYISGGANTTGVNYDNLRFTFNADGSAIYVDENGISRTANWQFISSDQRTIRFTISGSSSPFIWQMVEISGAYLHATENFTVASNTNNLHSFRLVQVP